MNGLTKTLLRQQHNLFVRLLGLVDIEEYVKDSETQA